MPKKEIVAAETSGKQAVSHLEDVLGHLKRAAESVGEKADGALDDALGAVRKAADYLANDAKKDTKALLDKAVKEAKAHPKTTAAIAAAAVAIAGVVVANEVRRRRK